VIYVFDSSTLIHLFTNFYPNRFPSLWERFGRAIESRTIVSTREVFNELDQYNDRLASWVKVNRDVFLTPSQDELSRVADIFSIPHFQSLVRKQERLQGKPVADPFVIAKASVLSGCVVTEEDKKPNASRIPNVCEHFCVKCANLEGFMEMEDWTF
jgi:hypothetical protein